MIVNEFESLESKENTALLCFHFSDESNVLGSTPPELDDSELEMLLSDVTEEDVYEGERGQNRLLYGPNLPADWICFSGLGEREEINAEYFRQASGDAVKKLEEEGIQHIVVLVPKSEHLNTTSYLSGRAFYEGATLALYSFDLYKSEEETSPNLQGVQYVVSEDERDDVKKGISDGTLYAEATEYARDLANEPPDVMNPTQLAEEAMKLESDHVHVNVMRKERIRELGMEPTLGVSAGSNVEPAQVELRYEPEDPKNPDRMIAVVGKGITFDSGGLNLKSGKGMMNMKFDMCGAAAVLGMFRVIEELAPPVRVLGMLACSENMTGPDAQKLRDVVKSYGGTTIEITNTDAEGRLVLSDALGYAADQGATEMIDIATLTGSVVTALGTNYAGLMGNDEEILNGLRKASKTSGELFWELPLVEEYNDSLTSPVADLRNTGKKRGGGAIVAGLFLQNFVEEVPWAHIDIAGTSSTDETAGYQVEGGTGFPVRTLLDYLQQAR